MDKNLLYGIAKDIRKRCVAFAMSRKARNYDFFKQYDLDCMCAVASFVLKDALRREGVSSQVIYGTFENNDHCWVEADGQIIDITATQFDVAIPDVYIVSKRSQTYKKTRTYKKPSDLRNWPCSQRPSIPVVKKILEMKA